MSKHITSAVKPFRTFLSFKDFNLLKSLAPSVRSFFNFMTACFLPCLHVRDRPLKKIWGEGRRAKYKKNIRAREN